MLKKIEDLLLLIIVKIIRGISSFLTKIVVFIIFGFYSIIAFLITKYCERRKRLKEEMLKKNQKIQHFYKKNLQKSSPERSTKSEQFIFLSSNENSNNPCKLKYVIKSDPILKKKSNLSAESNKKESQSKYSNSPSLKLTNKEIQLELKSDQEEIESIKLEKISQNTEKESSCKIKETGKRNFLNELISNSPEMILSQKSKSSTVNTSSSNYDTILMNLRKLNQNVLDSKYSQENDERKKEHFLEIMLSYKSLFNYDYSYCINNEPVFIFDLFNSIYPVFDYFGKEYKKNIARYLVKRGVSVNQTKNFLNNIKEYGEISEIKNILDVENNYDPVSFFTEVEIKTFHKFSPKIDSEVIKVFKGIKHKKFIFTIGDLKIIKSVLFSLGLDNFIDGIFYLDYNDKSIPTKKSIYPYEIIDMVIQTNKVYYFDNCEDNLHYAKKRGWNVFQVDEITFRKKMKSILKFLGFEIVSCE